LGQSVHRINAEKCLEHIQQYELYYRDKDPLHSDQLHPLDEGKRPDNLKKMVKLVQKARLVQAVDCVYLLSLVDSPGRAGIIAFSSLPFKPVDKVPRDLLRRLLTAHHTTPIPFGMHSYTPQVGVLASAYLISKPQ